MMALFHRICCCYRLPPPSSSVRQILCGLQFQWFSWAAGNESVNSEIWWSEVDMWSKKSWHAKMQHELLNRQRGYCYCISPPFILCICLFNNLCGIFASQLSLFYICASWTCLVLQPHVMRYSGDDLPHWHLHHFWWVCQQFSHILNKRFHYYAGQKASISY